MSCDCDLQYSRGRWVVVCGTRHEHQVLKSYRVCPARRLCCTEGRRHTPTAWFGFLLAWSWSPSIEAPFAPSQQHPSEYPVSLGEAHASCKLWWSRQRRKASGTQWSYRHGTDPTEELKARVGGVKLRTDLPHLLLPPSLRAALHCSVDVYTR